MIIWCMDKQVELVKARLAGKSHVYHKEGVTCGLSCINSICGI